MKRRNLIKLGLISSVGGAFLRVNATNPADINSKISKEYDLIIAGGGPAGVGAAIMASHLNMKTLLIEKTGCLGGIWTSGLLSYVMDRSNKSGVNKLIVKELNDLDGQINPQSWSYVYNPEDMKYGLERIFDRFKVDFLYHSKVVGVDGDGKQISSVKIASHSGIETFKAKVYIDATGNGELGAYAGAEFEVGHPVTGKTQPMTLMALLTGINEKKTEQYINNPGVKGKYKFAKLLEKNNIHPSYSLPTLWKINRDLYALMANHEYGVYGTESKDVTKATLHARKEIYEMIKDMRVIDGFNNVQLITTAEHIGIRGARRILGKYVMKKKDLINGSVFPDAVCNVNFGIDVHSLDPQKGKSIDKVNETKTKPYEIPARALVSKDISNLLMAGRCISGDFYAHSSYRVTGNSVALGEGASFIANNLINKDFALDYNNRRIFERLNALRNEIE